MPRRKQEIWLEYEETEKVVARLKKVPHPKWEYEEQREGFDSPTSSKKYSWKYSTTIPQGKAVVEKETNIAVTRHSYYGYLEQSKPYTDYFLKFISNEGDTFNGCLGLSEVLFRCLEKRHKKPSEKEKPKRKSKRDDLVDKLINGF
jgi:hypothetical protein